MGINIEQGRLHWSTGMDTSGFDRGIRKVDSGLDNVEKKSNNLGNSFKAVGAAVAGYLSVSAITEFGKKVMEISAEFQKFQAVLTNTLGSNTLATSIMGEIQQFAAVTPFGVRELTDAFVKLANQGFVPTGIQMRQLGDLAASTGKSFDQLAEAILDAQTGEYERLKEFGIRAKDAGDQVIFTFKGVATTVDKTSSSIRDYITNLGDAQGVTGSMEAISKTLGGQISNLEDNWDNLLRTIGEGTDGVFKDAISTLNTMIEAVTDYMERLNTASKFNLNERTVAGKKIVDMPGIRTVSSVENTDFIVQTQKDLKKSNDEFIKGAKYIREYSDQYKKLDIERRNQLKGVTKPELSNAINEIYEQAKAEIKARANQIIKDRNKTLDANFGTKKGGAGKKTEEEKQAERISAAYKKLSDELDLIGLDKKLSFEEINEKNISAYEGLIRSLIENGINPTDKAVTAATDKIFQFTQELFKIEGNKFGIDMLAKEFANVANEAVSAQKKFKSTVEEMENMVGSKTMEKLTSPPALKDNSKNLRKIADEAYEVSAAFYDWSDALSTVDEGLSNALAQIGSLAFGVSRLAEGIATKNIGGILGGVAGIAGTLIKSITSVSKKEREQAEYTYQLQLKQTEAVTKALERQIAAINEAYGVDRLTKYNESLLSIKNTYDGLNKSLSGKYSLSGDNELDKAIKMMNEGGNLPSFYREIIEALAKSGQIVDLSKFGEGLGDIANSAKALGDLETLLDLGKLDDQTAGVVANLVKQAKLYKDTLNAMKAETTGTTFSEIADSIVDMFERGTTSAEDFANNFEDIMKRAIINTFKRNYLEKELEDFYNKFYDYSSSNGELTTDEIATLEALYNGIIQNGEKRFSDLQKLSGIDFSTGGTTEANGLTGSIQASLTEATGSELAGLFRGQYDISKKQYTSLLSMDLNLVRLADIGMQKLNNLVAININTANTVTKLDSAIVELRAIKTAVGGRSDRDPS